MSIRLAEAPRESVAGLSVAGHVDAITETVARGWAWTPGQAAPLPVELRLGTEVVAEATADGLREDLARLGMNDGRHAFSLPVPETLRARLAELRVVARTPDGAAIALSTMSPPDAPSAAGASEESVSERLAHLTRGMEMLIGSQRLLHRNVQAALLAGSPTASEAGSPAGQPPGEDIAATQVALQEGIETLELFVTRLELGMAGLAPKQPVAAQPRWVLMGTAAVAATALVLSAWALVLALPG